MVRTPASTAFDRGVRPLLQSVLLDKADAVLSFRPDPELQSRIDELASRSTEGRLSEEERAEYEGYVRANKFIAILQRQARRMLRADPQMKPATKALAGEGAGTVAHEAKY